MSPLFLCLDFAHHPWFHEYFRTLWPDVPRYEVTHHWLVAIVVNCSRNYLEAQEAGVPSPRYGYSSRQDFNLWRSDLSFLVETQHSCELSKHCNLTIYSVFFFQCKIFHRKILLITCLKIYKEYVLHICVMNKNKWALGSLLLSRKNKNTCSIFALREYDKKFTKIYFSVFSNHWLVTKMVSC